MIRIRPAVRRTVGAVVVRWTRVRCQLTAGSSRRISGLWQVASTASTFEESVNIDLDYVEEVSMALDVRILLLTVLVTFRTNTH